VAYDSADVTSSRRSFHVCGPVTGKARLPLTVDVQSAGRHYQAIGADRTQRSTYCSIHATPSRIRSSRH